MQVRVKLPSGPLIPYFQFCRLIAQAVYPIDKDLNGIKCVLAKIFPTKAPTSYADVEAEVPYSLDETDRQAFTKIMSKLPPLHCPMSKEEADSFLNAYVNFPGRPMWIPLLENEMTIFKRKYDQNQVMDRHIKALREEHRAGRLVPVDQNYVPLRAVEMGARLPRQYAIAYLERHGLAYDEDSTGQEKASLTVIGKVKLSQSDRGSIVERHKKYTANKVRNRTALLAAEFNVSERTISDVVKKAKEEEDKKVETVIDVENMTSSWPRSAR